jgi:alpha,alpha-trehalose phosphorylase (configuration-retaining)
MQNTNTAQPIIDYLGQIYKETRELSLPAPAYLGIRFNIEKIEAAILTTEGVETTGLTRESLFSELTAYAHEHNLKFIAAGLQNCTDEISSRLWLEQDIVPIDFSNGLTAADLAREVRQAFDNNDLVKINIGAANEVDPSKLVTLADYQRTLSTEEFDTVTKLAEEFKGHRLTFINATPQGGGVALMRHAIIRLYRLLGVDAHWYVLHDKRPEVFDITKVKFHNVLQAVADPSIYLTEEDKKIYNSWIEENAFELKEVFLQSDVIVIDDPQPSGLIPYIKQANPKAKIIYRSHIQIVARLADQPGTPQNTTWNFIWSNIKDADSFITHPVSEFVPQAMAERTPIAMPPTTDPLDGLNKPLNKDQIDYYMKIFDKILVQEGHEPLDRQRPYIIQIARFDPSKGIPDVVESYCLLRKRMAEEGRVIPQLIIVGNGSVDDPDAVPIYNLVTELIARKNNPEISKDIKVARLPHIDQLLNTLLRESKVVLQLSHKEGFEIKVTEALMKGKPVIAYRSGGIPLQITENVNGFLVDAGKVVDVAQHMYELFTDENLYARMSSAAAQLARRDVLTATNAGRWLFLAVQLIKFGRVESDFPLPLVNQRTDQEKLKSHADPVV